ncbi:hypothetical protein CTAYLR_000684 [Chrysophaeum taylorii]|uniref:DNA ligase 1 n=1 Tax=Chrysophaeum taylorii TaxID=2483200 RepID=A0AAD7U9J1_9STRA|nr:hypothetical protein CTAYLR_000684 [Chrysophaeum taylorii]
MAPGGKKKARDIRSFFGAAPKEEDEAKKGRKGRKSEEVDSPGLEKKTGEEEETPAPAAKKAKVEESSSSSSDSSWAEGMPYLVFAEMCAKVEALTGRLEITGIVRDLMKEVISKRPEDLVALLYLLSKEIAPAFENVELGIGEALLMKAIGQACGKDAKQVKAEAAAKGDLGLAAEGAREKQRTLAFGRKPKALVARQVLEDLRAVAKISGSRSQDAKIGKMTKLLTAASPLEARYLVRALGGKMRIHLGTQTVLVALAHAVKPPGMSPDAAEEVVKSCYSEHPVLDALAACVDRPLKEWPARCSLSVGVPVKPMCAKAEKQVTAVLKRFSAQAFTCEHKYDGERLQAHVDNGRVKLFSRNCADTTKKWPDVVSYLREAGPASFILDAEVVAISKDNTFAPFQVLSTRAREAIASDVKVPVVVMAFDLLYLNGKSLLQLAHRERRDLLRTNLRFSDHLRLATGVDVDSKRDDDDDDGRSAIIQEAMEEAIKAKVEGLMVKALDQTYEPSKRSLNWLKLKKDYLDAFMPDSFDLVVVGAYGGKGKRAGTFGSYLLACYDPADGIFQTVCKVATGFSEKELVDLDQILRPRILPARPRHVVAGDSLQHDVLWLDPAVLFEVRAADLSLSSTHKGALDKLHPGRGIGLRFPRFERLRDDKDVDQATTATQVLDAYLEQDAVKNNNNNNDDDDDDDDDDGYL